MRSWIWATAALCAAGCGFSATQADGSVSQDLSFPAVGPPGGDLAGVDSATPPGADLAGALDGSAPDLRSATNTCTPPALLVLIQSNNGASQTGGKVLQIALGASGATQSCGRQLTAGNTLDNQNQAIAWLAPDRIVVAGQTGTVYFLDPVTDTYRGTYTPSNNVGFAPLSLFPIVTASNQSAVAVVYDKEGFDEADDVEVIDKTTTMKIISWDPKDTSPTGPLPLGFSIKMIVQSPLDPKHGFALRPDSSVGYAAADFPLPFDNQPVQITKYENTLPTSAGSTHTIYAIKASAGGGRRVAWATTNFSSGDYVFYTNDTGTGPGLVGPIRCLGNALCKSPPVYTDVVPDPTSSSKVIAVCQDANSSNTAHVVRFDESGDACETILDGTKLPLQTYPGRLAVMEAP